LEQSGRPMALFCSVLNENDRKLKAASTIDLSTLGFNKFQTHFFPFFSENYFFSLLQEIFVMNRKISVRKR